MNEQIIPKEVISESIQYLITIMPLPFILLVLMCVIWWGIVDLNGNTVKYYRIYTILIVLALASAAYFLIPDNETFFIKKISFIITSMIGSGFSVEILKFWRKNKSRKK